VVAIATQERIDGGQRAEPAPRTEQELRLLAEHAGVELHDASALEILTWADEQFGSSWCVASSMGDAVMAHLASRVRPGVDVLFLDTGYHFAETIGTRDAVAATMPVTLRTITPRRTVAQQDESFGARLFERNPDQCCAMRKVLPLREALTGYAAWATGLRRDEAATRADANVVEWDARRKMVKRRGPRTRSTPISPSTTCWSTRSCPTVTHRSDALRAPGASRPARMREPAAGRAPTKPSAGCTDRTRPNFSHAGDTGHGVGAKKTARGVN
jgi:phosphoadenosine phosphosulfate reductase